LIFVIPENRIGAAVTVLTRKSCSIDAAACADSLPTVFDEAITTGTSVIIE